MAVEAPADITILGLNRISIEVGLYARFLGYRVNLFGRKISVGLFADEETEFHGERATTTLGRRALEAQGHELNTNSVTNLLQLESEYLQPLAESDLLADSWFSGCRKITARLSETDLPEHPDEDVEYDTRVFLLSLDTDSDSIPGEVTADVLIDCRNQEETQDMDVQFEFNGAPNSIIERIDACNPVTKIDDFYNFGETISNVLRPINLEVALTEIRDLFRILGDSERLDLYWG